MERQATEVARVNRAVPIDASEMTAKAGSRLHNRYLLITRYSEMISPVSPHEEEVAAPLIFPA